MGQGDEFDGTVEEWEEEQEALRDRADHMSDLLKEEGIYPSARFVNKINREYKKMFGTKKKNRYLLR